MEPAGSNANLFPVLVFDPNFECGGHIAAELEKQGWTTCVAANAEDALRFVHRTYYRVVVVVGDLASDDCLGFLDALRRAAPRSWLIVENARVDEILEQCVHRHGGDALIDVSVAVEELARRISLLQVKSRPML
jgi:DNA-binding response OmpR family regulator